LGDSMQLANKHRNFRRWAEGPEKSRRICRKAEREESHRRSLAKTEKLSGHWKTNQSMGCRLNPSIRVEVRESRV